MRARGIPHGTDQPMPKVPAGDDNEERIKRKKEHVVDDCRNILALWLLGLVSSYTMGGLIHVLLVIAIVMVLVRLIQGRRVV